MDEVSMNDGLDAPDTIAFGLGAAETAALVLSLLMAYAATRSGLPGAIAWAFAALLASSGAALAWVRLAERSLLGWSVLLAAHAVRRRGDAAAAARSVMAQARVTVRSVMAKALVAARAGGVRARDRGRHLEARARRGAGQRRTLEAGAVTVRRLAQPGRPAVTMGQQDLPGSLPPRGGHGAWLVAFHSLRGGSGRTALVCEVAALLAARGHATAPGGTRRPLRVTVVDLCSHLPIAALRLGLTLPQSGGSRPPSTTRWSVDRHETGIELVCLSPPGVGAGTAGRVADVAELLDAVDATGADVVVLDLPCDLDPGCREALRRCDQVGVVMTPTAGGVLDCYWTTAQVRRLGLRDRMIHIVNRSHPGFDAGDALTDLGIAALVEVPDDPALTEAENQHTICALDSDGPAAMALCDLAAIINRSYLRGTSAGEGFGAWSGRAG